MNCAIIIFIYIERVRVRLMDYGCLERNASVLGTAMIMEGSWF